jgi:hypothetical protein
MPAQHRFLFSIHAYSKTRCAYPRGASDRWLAGFDRALVRGTTCAKAVFPLLFFKKTSYLDPIIFKIAFN